MLYPNFRRDDAENEKFRKLPDGRTSLGVIDGFEIPPYDYIGASYPNPTTEVYTYKQGGASGSTVATVTVIFTNAEKNILVSATKI